MSASAVSHSSLVTRHSSLARAAGRPWRAAGACAGPLYDKTGLTLPVASYDHGLGCAIAGGYVYRGARSPPLPGAYLLGDYCSGRVWMLARGGAGAG